MLPKVMRTPSPLTARKENIASCLIIEDHLKSMLSQTRNTTYKPWKNKFAPKYPHSCFGDFSKDILCGFKKPIMEKKQTNFEESHASTYSFFFSIILIFLFIQFNFR